MESRLPPRVRPHVSRGPSRARQPPPPAARRERHAPPPPPRTPLLLLFTRHGIGALAVVAGIVAMCFGNETALIGGAGLVGAGIASWLIAWLYRIGVEGDRARDAEQRARDYFERNGRWPAP